MFILISIVDTSFVLTLEVKKLQQQFCSFQEQFHSVNAAIDKLKKENTELREKVDWLLSYSPQQSPIYTFPYSGPPQPYRHLPMPPLHPSKVPTTPAHHASAPTTTETCSTRCNLDETPPLTSKSPTSTQGPIPFSTKSEALPSSNITTQGLISKQDALFKYSKLQTESRVETLAVKLAKEVFFGSAVMQRCTVSGCRGLPGLPVKEVNSLKETLFRIFPKYQANPVGFEPLWATCVSSINQSCKQLRYGAKSTITV